ncbi:MFS transporter [Actinomyces radicidentis]|nr:MFS transporter [Actinomyces radicidentis]
MTEPGTDQLHEGDGPLEQASAEELVAGRVEGMSFRPDRRFWVVYLCLMMVQFLSAMYQTAVTTALPTVIGDLGGVAHMSWGITAYTLGQRLATPVTGKLGDLVGRKPLYLTAIALFVGGSALCVVSTGMLEFTAFRFLQGLGGGGLMISSQAITGYLIPPRVRGTYMVPMGAIFGIASVLGPLLGGGLTDALGCRWMFWFFLPFGIIAWVAVALALRMPRRRGRVSVDWAGLALTSVGATGIVLIATWGGGAYAWTSPVMLGIIPQEASAWWFGAAVFVLQLGVGMFLQLSVLIIHNALPASLLGTGTSANNFFREIGVSVGNTLVGVLFTSRLTSSLLGLGMSADAASSISPETVSRLDGSTASAVVDAYQHALGPVLIGLAPVCVLAALVALLLRPVPLSTRTGLEQLAEETGDDDGLADVPGIE